MDKTYLKQGDKLLFIEGAYTEVPEGAEIISETEYKAMRKEVLDEVSRLKSEYINNLSLKKQQARDALVALGLDADLVNQVIK